MSQDILRKINNNLSNKYSNLFIFKSQDSDIKVNFPVPIQLNNDYNYELGLLWFACYNTIDNITPLNNTLSLINKDNAGKYTSKKITIDPGAYELSNLYSNIYTKLGFNKENMKDCPIVFSPNISTGKTKMVIQPNNTLDFKDSKMNNIFGFVNKRYEAGTHISEHRINISTLNTISIECNIVEGAFVNGEQSNILYSFPSNTVEKGYKFIERMYIPLYLPVTQSVISNIRIRIIDDENNLVNFNKEHISLCLHLKQV